MFNCGISINIPLFGDMMHSNQHSTLSLLHASLQLDSTNVAIYLILYPITYTSQTILYYYIDYVLVHLYVTI